MIVYTNNGQSIELKEPALGKGGEGAVYAIKGDLARVVKLYHRDAESHREKVEAMVAQARKVAANAALANVAWPMAALYEDRAATRFVGFSMRRIDNGLTLGALHTYPNPRGLSVSQRDKVDFLVSLSETVAALHGMGQVVGDLNDNNVLMVRRSNKAALVDVDSLYFRTAGRAYRCEVLMDDIAAPEILRARASSDKSLAGLPQDVFSVRADNYALAVHIFRLLMNGAHPFALVRVSKDSVAAPKRDTFVVTGRSTFFMKVNGMGVPPFAPRLGDLPSYLVEMFRRAFVLGASEPSVRPSASEWGSALNRYRSELVCCSSHPAHWYWRGVHPCPYCAADKRYLASLRASAPKPVSATPPHPVAPSFAPVTSPGPAAPSSGACYIPAPHAPTSSPAPLAAPLPPASVAPGKGLGLAYWAAVTAIALGVFWLLGVATPICESLGNLLGLGYPMPLQFAFAIAAVAGAVCYSRTRVTSANASSYALAGVASAGGIAALAAGIVAAVCAFGVIAVFAFLALLADA